MITDLALVTSTFYTLQYRRTLRLYRCATPIRNKPRIHDSTVAFSEYKDEIPFVAKAPIDEAETKKAKKQKEGQAKKA